MHTDLSTYDQAGDFYFNFIQHGLVTPQSMFQLALEALLKLLGEVDGKVICDVACGEGHLSRVLANRGAIMTGVDLSTNLLEHAKRQSSDVSITFIRDDVQALSRLDANMFDAAVCNLALMDIPDLAAVLSAVRRVLRNGGRFVFSILHPCFETPYRVPESHLELDTAGNFVAFIVRRYATEGYWNSGGTGIRGTFGAYHRMLSTYLNTLVDAGFEVERCIEPTLPRGEYTELSLQVNSQVPQVLVVAATNATKRNSDS